MKDIKILELGASNFRGQNFLDNYGGRSASVSGRNRSGKSTRLAAWCWLMSAYTDPNSTANAKLFDDRAELTKDTPTASVWAVVDIDGEEYRIERTAKARFTRKKGTDTYEKSPSDEYGYSIDSVERSASDFKEWLSENVAPDDMMRFALCGEFFVGQVFADKKKARGIIERVVGEVTREEMAGDYGEIDALLDKYSLDDIENRAANLSKAVKQRLDAIPAIVAGIEKEIAEIDRNDFAADAREIARLEAEREDCERRQLDLTERLRPQMEARAAAVEAKQMKWELFKEAFRKWRDEPQEEIARLTREVAAVRRQNADSRAAYDAAADARARKEAERAAAEAELRLAEERRARCVEERDAEMARTFSQEDASCAYCGAPLTGQMLDEAEKKFECAKRENIRLIVARGKAAKNEAERLSAVIAAAEEAASAPLPEVICQDTAEQERRINELTKDSMARGIEAFGKTEHGKALLEEAESVEVPEVRMPDDTEIKGRKDEINAALVPLYERRGLKGRADSLREEVAALRDEQAEKGMLLATYERQRLLVRQYKQEQMEILSRKVNAGLRHSRVEVWSRQKDGTAVPDLVLKDAQGVSYSTTNNASRIITAVDVQRFFCDRLGVNMPCWVDESSVIDDENLPRIDGAQMFYLYRADTGINVELK